MGYGGRCKEGWPGPPMAVDIAEIWVGVEWRGGRAGGCERGFRLDIGLVDDV